MFDERLQATLSLSVGGTKLAIPAGAIESLTLDARVFGFSAEVTFRVSLEGGPDAVLEPFCSSAPMQATLSLANGALVLAGETPDVATFAGYVTERRFVETTTGDVSGAPVIERRYTLRFADAARVFWGAHRPLAVYANRSLREVIDANLVEGVTVEYDFADLDLTRDVVCVASGGANDASFYDFVFWVVSELCGVVELDAASGTYRIAKSKSEPESVGELDVACVESISVVLPELARHATAVLNPFSEATVPKLDVANEVAATGVRRDVMAHTPVPKVAEQRAALEGDRLRQRDHHLSLGFRRLPAAIPAPGLAYTLGGGLSARAFAAGKQYRVIALSLRAGPVSVPREPVDLEDPCKRFDVELSAELERVGDPVPNLPAFVRPIYPVLAEGKILSASGTDSDRTWHALSSENDSVVRYRVQIPLWNQTVVLPFVPFGESGHFFFPANKHQRVLVAFDFDSAKIVSFLDWVEKLSGDTQGNQLVMGKRTESRTVMRHVYTDESPVFTLSRTQWGDCQTIELSEGRFFLEVKQEEGAATPDETYDLTPQVEMAKDSTNAETRAVLGGLTGSYQAASGKATSALSSAVTELEASTDAATRTLSDKIAAVSAALASEVTALSALGETLDARIAEAKASLQRALEG
ncbi:MAG: hypothetical protein DIU78_011500 [Pseudomonadota bacterium]|nr:MAG: hypothetical protein DIU78_00805 [Pseudomonadota bacterium]